MDDLDLMMEVVFIGGVVNVGWKKREACFHYLLSSITPQHTPTITTPSVSPLLIITKERVDCVNN